MTTQAQDQLFQVPLQPVTKDLWPEHADDATAHSLAVALVVAATERSAFMAANGLERAPDFAANATALYYGWALAYVLREIMPSDGDRLAKTIVEASVDGSMAWELPPEWMEEYGLDPESVISKHQKPEPSPPVYLIWSTHHDAWWGPRYAGQTPDVWAAGRYGPNDAERETHAWPASIMVLAPEHGKTAMTLEEIQHAPRLMADRVDEALRVAAVADAQFADTTAEVSE